MAQNNLPTTANAILALGNCMLAGLQALGASLGITQITPAAFEARLTAFSEASGGFNAARSAQGSGYEAFHAADAVLAAWLATAKAMFTARRGARWSEAWAAAGFTNHSTAIPKLIAGRLALAGGMAAYFPAHPGAEVPALGVTAARAAELQGATRDAQQAAGRATVALKQAGAAREAARVGLATMMRALVCILNATLAKDDSRWLSFGLNIPAGRTTPGQPQEVTASAGGEAGQVIVVQCAATPLATRYRWRMRTVGAPGDYRLAASSRSPLATIRNVPPGRSVAIIVQAVNGNLQGVASEPVVLAVPVVAAAETLEKVVAVVTTHGIHGNGHVNNGHEAAARV
ncbi:MAG: hypothetical protein JO117_01005 [Verrucomicrobia bacterium]|nr:hypothetical protein [Verrucomicrobiota bacterium]MBV9657724.1 hypothetical protein [Verrucomicrobiota bacterium]